MTPDPPIAAIARRLGRLAPSSMGLLVASGRPILLSTLLLLGAAVAASQVLQERQIGRAHV